MNGRLTELVARAVDAELDQLVGAELERRRFDDGERSPRDEQPQPSVMTKTCSGCGQTSPVDQFEHGRRRCRSCRRAQRHPGRRPTGDDAKEPHPAHRWKWRDEDELREERRKLIAAAPVEKQIDEQGREWTIRRLPAAFVPG
jgi:hypothetical protein